MRIVRAVFLSGHHMTPHTETQRVKRSWTEKLLLWERAYETKIWLSGHEVTGRGPTQRTSEEAAIKKWNGENSQLELGKIFEAGASEGA
jgi:hypothetical protein